MYEFNYVLSNGYISNEQMKDLKSEGWIFITTISAKDVNEKAYESDKLTIFSRYKGE